MKKYLILKCVTAALLIFSTWLVCCKKEKKTVPTTPPPYPTGGDSTGNSFPVVQVNIINYHFSPMNVSSMKGASISWTNRDSVTHTVSSFSGEFESGDLLPGRNYFIPFNTTGSFDYYCQYHKETGKIVIH